MAIRGNDVDPPGATGHGDWSKPRDQINLGASSSAPSPRIRDRGSLTTGFGTPDELVSSSRRKNSR